MNCPNKKKTTLITKITMIHSHGFFLWNAALLICLTLVMWGTATPSQATDLTFTGKLVCSLKRPVVLPVEGEILSLSVAPGQKVKKGQILGRYRLIPESIQKLSRHLAPTQINELRARLAEIDKGLALLRNKEKSLKELASKKLAAPQNLEQVQQQIKALTQQRAAYSKGLGQAQQTLQQEKALVQEQLGVPVETNQIPHQGVLEAPIDGHVVWMHPNLRPGAVLKGGTPVIMVGVMDPMILRALVHEIEALKLKVGDEAVITMESLPDRKFTAKVSRLPWAPTAITLDQPTYYEVEFEVPNPNLVLKEGLKATLEIKKPSGTSTSGPAQDKGGKAPGKAPGT
jgi:macrolide-specific efflux system membrane fusion protein